MVASVLTAKPNIPHCHHNMAYNMSHLITIIIISITANYHTIYHEPIHNGHPLAKNHQLYITECFKKVYNIFNFATQSLN